MTLPVLGFVLAVHAETLPGISLPFSPDSQGRWALPAELPAAFAQAGVKPGWVLAEVDGQPATDLSEVQRRVAAGPARNVQLGFETGAEPVVVVVPRAALVVVDEVGLLPWPEGFSPPPGPWHQAPDGRPQVLDGAGTAWQLDPATGALSRTDRLGQESEIAALFWARAPAGTGWVIDRDAGLSSGDAAWARGTLAGAARIRGFQGRSGDHLLVPEAGGLSVLSVTWPAGTPDLPACIPAVPETCLVAAQQVQAELGDRPGAREEVLRQLGLACAGGVHRACVEAVAVEDPTLAVRAADCVGGEAGACHEVARSWLKIEPEGTSDLVVGLLEFACATDASGSLGERLRRQEDVGEGCVLLSAAYDRRKAQDQALLSLDQACVLGRAGACTEAQERRRQAYALRTVRECESPDLPLASACVTLGGLLQDGPIAATTLDGFAAYLRACQLGDEEGCKLLGDYVDRWGIENPRVMAAEADLLAACQGGERRACVGGAWLQVRHEPRSDAYAQALQTFASACESGLASACIAGAEQRRIGRARAVQAPEPVAMWKAACELQSPPGCAGLGERLSRARSTWEGAYEAWVRACDTGEAHACTRLGDLVAERHDPWPEEQAPEIYRKQGCEHGDPEGCFRLAEDQLPRKGDPPEPAYLLLERSCSGDYGLACARLAAVHIDRKTSFDEEIAAGHFQSACDNGHYESCKVLGTMYLRGRGVERDRQRARELAQRYSVNARRRHVRVGVRGGFPSMASGEAELVLPVPVGPALAATGSYAWLPGLGSVLMLVEGREEPEVAPDLTYVDAGVRLYPNNKARGMYGMAGVHRLVAEGGDLRAPLTRSGLSARLGLMNESRGFFTRIEIGLGQYGIIDLADFDEDEVGTFPLLQPVIGVSFGFALL